MKSIVIPLFTFTFVLHLASAAVPLTWTVETTRAQPATFEAYQGETIAFEAALQSRGKPLEAPSNYSFFWQTNGMGSTYWESPCTGGAGVPPTQTNVLFASWLPSMDVGARVYNCFIGTPSNIYHAAFQLRLRPSPGATPNVLPLPVPVIDFATVRVLNPPWESGGGGGVTTNAVIAIANDTIDTNDTVKALAEATNKLTSSVSRLESSKIPYDEWGGISMHEYNFKENGVDRGALTTGGVVIKDEDGYPKTNVSWPDGDGKFALDSDVAAAQSAADAADAKADAAQSAADEADAKADEALADANDANVWSSATYNFMTGGRTNCWFSGTNYVFGSDAATRTRFAWEDGMDAATVPCSMALWEIRDGERQLVWDQRDWTVWYWSFKSRQMMATVQGKIDALGNAVTNDANYAWSKRYASDGTPNPDASTTFIDTPSVTLSPGMKWETVATVSGAAYWTIVGNGAVIGGSGTNAVLRITDFEGNDIMTVTKGEHRLAWLERGDITGQMYDSDGWVCFDMLADVEPVGYFSTTLESSDFLPQTDPNCPAQYRWENIGGGKYRVHFMLKPGISANACFAKFQVEIEGQTIIRYNAGQEISGGLIYNGVKIAPDISGSPAVGTVVQWKVVR